MRAALLACLLLAGCSVPQSNANLNASLAKLAAVTIADLNAAAADAGSHGDVLAAACYPALANWVMTMQQQSGQPTAPVGAFSAFQASRDILKSGMGGIPASIKLGCGGLYLDVQGDVMSFVALLARISAGGGVLP